MSHRFMAKLVMLISFVLIASLPAQATNLSKGEQIDIVINSNKFHPNYRKFVYYYSEMQSVRERYRQDPSQFTKRVSIGRDRFEKRQMSLGEVLEAQSAGLKRRLNGADLAESDLYQSLKSLTSLVPGAGGSISANVLDALERYNPNKAGQVPLSWDLDFSGLGEMLTDGQKGDPEFQAYIREAFKENLGVELGEDFSSHPAVRAFIEAQRAENRGRLLGSKVDEANQKLTEVDKKLQAQLQKAQNQAERRRAQREFEYRKAEILGGLNSVAMGFDLMGEKDLARTTSTFAQMTNIGMDLTQTMKTMGPLAFANSYMMMATLAINLVQGFGQQDSMESRLMEQLEQVMKSIEQLSEQMHDRFSVIDRQLAKMMETMGHSFGELSKDINQINRKLSTLEWEVEKLSNQLSKLSTSEIERDLRDMEKQCFNDYINASVIAPEQFDDCVQAFVSGATEYSMRNQYTVWEPTPLSQVHFGNVERPYTDFILDLVQGAHDLAGGSYLPQITSIPHPRRYETNVRRLFRLVKEYPQYKSRIARSSIEAMLKGGERVRAVYNNLILQGPEEKKRVRWPVINAVLARYKTAVDDVIERVESIRRNSNQYSMDTLQGPEQHIHYDIAQPRIGWCASHKRGVDLYISKTWERGREVERRYHRGGRPTHNWDNILETPSGFDYPTDFSDLLPNELKWAERLGLGSIGVCIKDMRFPVMQQDNLPIYHRYSFNFRTELEISFTWNAAKNPKVDKPQMKKVVIARPVIVRDESHRPAGGYRLRLLYTYLWKGHRYFGTEGERYAYFKGTASMWSKDHVQGTLNSENLQLVAEMIRNNRLGAFDKKAIDETRRVTSKLQEEVSGLFNFLQAAALIGLKSDLSEMRAVESALSPFEGLLEIDPLVQMIYSQNLSKDQVKAEVEKRVATLTDSLNDLDSAPSLTPKTDWLDVVLSELEDLKKEVE